MANKHERYMIEVGVEHIQKDILDGIGFIYVEVDYLSADYTHYSMAVNYTVLAIAIV